MVIYNGPVEDMVENPDNGFIKDIFFNKGDGYWKQGSGDSSLETEACSEQLVFFYDEPYGFFIMRHPDYLVPFDKSIKINTIEHLVGGEPMKVPTCSYVNREMAYKIAEQFIRTEKIPGFVKWTDLYDIEFDYDF